MDCQLKQTAFFGTERRPRSPERHYKAPGTQSPLPDITCRVRVGRGSEPATDTQKIISVRPVLFVDQAAAGALPTCVARIDQHNSDTLQGRLVADQFSQLSKAPISHPRPLVPLGLDPVPDTPEVFEGNQAPTAFGIGDDGFAQDMVRVALEARLLAGSAPERTLGGTGADLLQGPASGVLATAHVLDLRAGVALAGLIDREVYDAHVDANGVIRADQGRFDQIAGGREHPLSAHEHQVYLTLCILQQFALPNPAGEWDNLPARQRPNRDRVDVRQKTEDALVVGLCGMSMEGALRLLVASLEAVGNLRNAPHRDLSREPELGPHLGVAELVQVVLPSGLGLHRQSREPVAGRVAPFQGVAQQGGLFGLRQQTDRGDELHRSDALLGFDVAAHDGLRDSPDRAGVVAAAPKSRESGTQRGELLAQYPARPPLEAVDDLGDGKGWIGLHEQMHMVRHHLDGMHGHFMVGSYFAYQFFKARINGRDQHLPPVFRAPDEVILQAKDRSGVGSVSWFGGHASQYTGVGHLCKRSSRDARPAIPLSPKDDSFSRRTL
jgi:hypothetical protein